MFPSLSKRSQEKKISEARVPLDILLSYLENSSTKLLIKLLLEKQEKMLLQLSPTSKLLKKNTITTNTAQKKAVEEEIDLLEVDQKEKVDQREEADQKEKAYQLRKLLLKKLCMLLKKLIQMPVNIGLD